MIRFLKNTQKKKFIGKEIKCEGGKSDLSTDVLLGLEYLFVRSKNCTFLVNLVIL